MSKRLGASVNDKASADGRRLVVDDENYYDSVDTTVAHRPNTEETGGSGEPHYQDIDGLLAEPTNTVMAFEITKRLGDVIRGVTGRGWTPVLNPCFCTLQDLRKLRYSMESVNSSTADSRILRPSLLPGLLKTLPSNAAIRKPIMIFECGVVHPDSGEAGMKGEQRIAATFLHKKENFNFDQYGLRSIRKFLDAVMSTIGVKNSKDGGGYYVKRSENPSFDHGSSGVIVGPR
uniref:tRNA_synthFbeta domain-containing protein n=1 Tax=Caenorhabditis tropicalis TaxID=1561998 RepID=A0A1I7UF66_9PELO